MQIGCCDVHRGKFIHHVTLWVKLGSGGDCQPCLFYPNNRHLRLERTLPFRATTGLMHRSKTQSFDHLIGQLLNVCGDIEAKHPGGLQVDPQFDPRRLLHRKLAGLGSV